MDEDSGALVLTSDTDDADVHALKVLLTDSNHYRLPTDDPEGQLCEEASVPTRAVETLQRAIKNINDRILKKGYGFSVSCAQEDQSSTSLTLATQDLKYGMGQERDNTEGDHATCGAQSARQSTDFAGTNTGLTVLFPVGYRYSWGTINSMHRNYISKVQTISKPIGKPSSPECRLWTAMCNVRRAGAAAAERQDEVPMLKWLFNDNVTQDGDGHGYINENGFRSQIWVQSPLKQNGNIANNKTRRADGCAHGYVNADNQPLEKPYRFDTNIHMNMTSMRRPGRGTQRHAVIERSVPGQGIKRTAYTTIYTMQMCKSLGMYLRTVTLQLQLLVPKARRQMLFLQSRTVYWNQVNGVDFAQDPDWHYPQALQASSGLVRGW
ncbi:unnamed protein product, partial [Prorocentrum cordatum]